MPPASHVLAKVARALTLGLVAAHVIPATTAFHHRLEGGPLAPLMRTLASPA
jgi:hypothetical protein